MERPIQLRSRYQDSVLGFALDRIAKGKRIALITLVSIEGSSPRPLGAQMAVSESGEWLGYLSGGCIERAVVAEAMAAIEKNENRLIRFGRGSKYFDIQLPCGSAIELYFDVHVGRNSLERAVERLEARQEASLSIPVGGPHGEVLTRHYQPLRKLLVFGVGPAAVQLSLLGAQAEFETTLFSPDSLTRESVQFGQVSTRLVKRSSAPSYRADKKTAIVFMFHDHEWEQWLIPAALETEAFYIGAMGSARTQQKRLSRLAESGIDPAQVARIRGPVGVFHGAKSAPDIAVSVLSEIIREDLKANPARQLSEQKEFS